MATVLYVNNFVYFLNGLLFTLEWEWEPQDCGMIIILFIHVYNYYIFSCTFPQICIIYINLQNPQSRLKKGGGPGHGLVRPCGARSAPNCFRERIMHSVLGRSGGMLLYKFRLYESASEAVGDHHNYAKCLTTGLY